MKSLGTKAPFTPNWAGHKEVQAEKEEEGKQSNAIAAFSNRTLNEPNNGEKDLDEWMTGPSALHAVPNDVVTADVHVRSASTSPSHLGKAQYGLERSDRLQSLA